MTYKSDSLTKIPPYFVTPAAPFPAARDRAADPRLSLRPGVLPDESGGEAGARRDAEVQPERRQGPPRHLPRVRRAEERPHRGRARQDAAGRRGRNWAQEGGHLRQTLRDLDRVL